MSNIDSFQQAQLQLTQCIRDGSGELDNIESRRLTIYKELFFNNIEGFCATAFPVIKSILGEVQWLDLVRRFFVEHQCETPHFIEISQEFLSYLIEKQRDYQDFPFIAELAHYEWIELDLSVKANEDNTKSNETLDFKASGFKLSEACYPLLYNYPVHMISKENSNTIRAELTGLLVYRNKDFDVKFMLIDQLTVVMLQFIQQNNAITKSQLASDLMGLNESFTEPQIDTFLSNALPKFIELKLVTTV